VQVGRLDGWMRFYSDHPRLGAASIASHNIRQFIFFQLMYGHVFMMTVTFRVSIYTSTDLLLISLYLFIVFDLLLSLACIDFHCAYYPLQCS